MVKELFPSLRSIPWRGDLCRVTRSGSFVSYWSEGRGRHSSGKNRTLSRIFVWTAFLYAPCVKGGWYSARDFCLSILRGGTRRLRRRKLK